MEWILVLLVGLVAVVGCFVAGWSLNESRYQQELTRRSPRPRPVEPADARDSRDRHRSLELVPAGATVVDAQRASTTSTALPSGDIEVDGAIEADDGVDLESALGRLAGALRTDDAPGGDDGPEAAS